VFVTPASRFGGDRVVSNNLQTWITEICHVEIFEVVTVAVDAADWRAWHVDFAKATTCEHTE
jgi:hypothetical protein